MNRSVLTLLSLTMFATACGADSEALDDACSLVARAQQVAERELSGSASEAGFDAVTDALDAAHASVARLSSREVRQLVRDCNVVSGVGSATYRDLTYSVAAVDLREIERRLVTTFREAEEAQRRFDRDVQFACDAFREVDEAAVQGAIKRLAGLDRAVALSQNEWTIEQRNLFIAGCDVELDRDWAAAREVLVSIAATEQQQIDQRKAEQAAAAKRQADERARAEAEAARRETEEMFTVLVQMEQAWNSISRGDRATICAMFREDRIGTAQRWVRLSGYGKPEYAFVFLSQACR